MAMPFPQIYQRDWNPYSSYRTQARKPFSMYMEKNQAFLFPTVASLGRSFSAFFAFCSTSFLRLSEFPRFRTLFLFTDTSVSIRCLTDRVASFLCCYQQCKHVMKDFFYDFFFLHCGMLSVSNFLTLTFLSYMDALQESKGLEDDELCWPTCVDYCLHSGIRFCVLWWLVLHKHTNFYINYFPSLQ